MPIVLLICLMRRLLHRNVIRRLRIVALKEACRSKPKRRAMPNRFSRSLRSMISRLIRLLCSSKPEESRTAKLSSTLWNAQTPGRSHRALRTWRSLPNSGSTKIGLEPALSSCETASSEGWRSVIKIAPMPAHFRQSAPVRDQGSWRQPLRWLRTRQSWFPMEWRTPKGSPSIRASRLGR